jgi:hypothetical protein
LEISTGVESPLLQLQEALAYKGHPTALLQALIEQKALRRAFESTRINNLRAQGTSPPTKADATLNRLLLNLWN